MTNLLNKVSEILQKILPLVQENDPLFYPALNSRWTYYKPYQFKEHEDVGERKEIKPGDAERFSHCVREIVGSKNSNSEPCTISDECKEAMMTRGAPEALLYYQAMFFILGEVSGTCSAQIVMIVSHLILGFAQLESRWLQSYNV